MTIGAQLNIIAAHLGDDNTDEDFRSASNACRGSVVDYGADLPHAACAIAQKILARDVTLVDPRKNNLTGLSGLPIFFAAADDKPALTIKAFPCARATYAKTLWAQHHIHHVLGRVPLIRGVGCAQHDGEDYFLIAADFVDGVVVNDLVLTLAAMAHGNKRVIRASKISRVIAKIGGLLGTLHVADTRFVGEQTLVVKQRHEQAFAKTVALIKLMPELAVNVSRFNTSLSVLMHQYSDHHYRYAFIHGDAHPGNYIYRAEHDDVFALDLDNGASSISAHFSPRGSPFTDYSKFVNSMKVREIFGITAEESSLFRTAFEDGYERAGALVPARDIADFYTVMEVLDYAAWFFDHHRELAHDVKPVMTKILQRGFSWLTAIIADVGCHDAE